MNFVPLVVCACLLSLPTQGQEQPQLFIDNKTLTFTESQDLATVLDNGHVYINWPQVEKTALDRKDPNWFYAVLLLAARDGTYERNDR